MMFLALVLPDAQRAQAQFYVHAILSACFIPIEWGKKQLFADRFANNAKITNRDNRSRDDLAIKIVHLEQKIQYLYKMLQFTRLHKLQLIASTSLNVAWQKPNQALIVPVGAKNGVQLNDWVCTSQGFLGKVEHVGTHVSRIIPLTHERFRLPIMFSKSGLQAIISGDGSPCPVIIYFQVPSACYVPHVDEMVVTSSLNGGYAGIPLGRLSCAMTTPQTSLMTKSNKINVQGSFSYVPLCKVFPRVQMYDVQHVMIMRPHFVSTDPDGMKSQTTE